MTGRLKLRRDDTCVACGQHVPAGTQAWWDGEARTVTCLPCKIVPMPSDPAPPENAELDHGIAGGSAAREYERRRRAREDRVRARHPRIGGVLLALSDGPQHERAFRQGAGGERDVAASLERRTAEGPAVLLHDRRMWRGLGNVDHLAVAPTGVFVIDAKAIRGKVRVSRPLLGQPTLTVNGRDRTKLVDGLDRQVDAVRRAVEAVSDREVPVIGVFCFTDADLPLLGTPSIRGHLLLYRKALARRLNATGSLDDAAIQSLARILADRFPPA